MDDILFNTGVSNLNFCAAAVEARVYQSVNNSHGQTSIEKNTARISSAGTQATEIRAWYESSLKEPLFRSATAANVSGTLRLLVSVWPQETDLGVLRKNIPLTKEAFTTVMHEMSLPKAFPYHYHLSFNTAVGFGYPNDSARIPLTAIFRTPIFKQTEGRGSAALALSYDHSTNATNAYLIGVKTAHFDRMLDRLDAAKHHATHPLALPVLLYLFYLDKYRETNDQLAASIGQVQDSSGVMEESLLTRHLEVEIRPTLDFTKLHEKIVYLQDRATTSFHHFLDDIKVEMEQCFNVLESFRDKKVNQEAHVMVKAIFMDVCCAARVEGNTAKRYSQKLECQHKVLYFLMQQKDSNINQAIAMDSKKLAEASKRDSSSMKAIAALTMIFLPGTAVATMFSMSQFFVTRGDTLYATSTFWVFWAVTIPLTLLVMVTWLGWMWVMQRIRDKRLMQIESGEKVSD